MSASLLTVDGDIVETAPAIREPASAPAADARDAALL
jgi:hypothetical protein